MLTAWYSETCLRKAAPLLQPIISTAGGLVGLSNIPRSQHTEVALFRSEGNPCAYSSEQAIYCNTLDVNVVQKFNDGKSGKNKTRAEVTHGNVVETNQVSFENLGVASNKALRQLLWRETTPRRMHIM